MARKKPNKSRSDSRLQGEASHRPSGRNCPGIQSPQGFARLVGNVLHRAKGVKKGTKGRKASGKATGLTLESLLAAKKLVADLGGIENVRAALTALERLG